MFVCDNGPSSGALLWRNATDTHAFGRSKLERSFSTGSPASSIAWCGIGPRRGHALSFPARKAFRTVSTSSSGRRLRARAGRPGRTTPASAWRFNRQRGARSAAWRGAPGVQWVRVPVAYSGASAGQFSGNFSGSPPDCCL